MRVKQTAKFLIVGAMILGAFVPQVSAQSPSSGSFRVDEYQFGTGGEVDLQSNQFRANASTGSLGVGSASSANFDAEAGFITADQPFLEMVVTNLSADLGLLESSSTSSASVSDPSCSCSFYVRTYLSSGYVVVTMSPPPTSEGGAVLDAKTVKGVPSTDQSVEEFGMNIVDNATPNLGANPVNVPDDTYADGEAAPDYATPDQFKYNVGDIIARSQKTAGRQGVGQTNYTLTYIAKRKPITEAGLYTMNHDIVVVATF